MCTYTLVYIHTLRRKWQPTPVLLPGTSHGQRSLIGCSPWGHQESDMTEWLHFPCSLSCIGEGNGNPLQCSCLENPRDRGAWWAAVYGFTHSQTWLKWLSSCGTLSKLGETGVSKGMNNGCVIHWGPCWRLNTTNASDLRHLLGILM